MLSIAAVVVGLIADIGLLLYGYRSNPQFGIAAGMPEAVLRAGYILGVCAIPLYTLGSALIVRDGLRSSRFGRPYFIMSVVTAVVATLAHAMTASGVSFCVANGSTEIFSRCLLARDHGRIIVVWLALLMCVLILSMLLIRAVLRHNTLFPRYIAAMNPLNLFVLFTAAATTLGPYAQPVSFLVPDLAILLFTLLITRVTLHQGRHPDRPLNQTSKNPPSGARKMP